MGFIEARKPEHKSPHALKVKGILALIFLKPCSNCLGFARCVAYQQPMSFQRNKSHRFLVKRSLQLQFLSSAWATGPKHIKAVWLTATRSNFPRSRYAFRTLSKRTPTFIPRELTMPCPVHTSLLGSSCGPASYKPTTRHPQDHHEIAHKIEEESDRSHKAQQLHHLVQLCEALNPRPETLTPLNAKPLDHTFTLNPKPQPSTTYPSRTTPSFLTNHLSPS